MQVTTNTVMPVAQAERAEVIDVLRGFALTGVLIANFTAYTEQMLPSTVLDSISSSLDRFLIQFNGIFIEWKFFTLFSILFGYGFGLILSSLEKKGIDPELFFIRRMFWLFIFGMIHTVFWWADVLHLYAISGLLLLLFRKSPSRTLLACAVLFMFFVPGIISFLFRSQPDAFNDDNMAVLYQHLRHGNVIDIFRANLALYYKAFIVSGADLHDIVETLGRFLFGYFLVRVRLFERTETKKPLFRKVLAITAPFTFLYFILVWWGSDGSGDTLYWEPIVKLGIFFTTCFYSCMVVLGYLSFGPNIIFTSLRSLGRMTMTNYLLISAFQIMVLYGIGFGKLGVLPIHSTWLLAVGWLLVEISFSTWWLSKFRYGPVEWIWRQLTYGKRLLLRI